MVADCEGMAKYRPGCDGREFGPVRLELNLSLRTVHYWKCERLRYGICLRLCGSELAGDLKSRDGLLC